MNYEVNLVFFFRFFFVVILDSPTIPQQLLHPIFGIRTRFIILLHHIHHYREDRYPHPTL